MKTLTKIIIGAFAIASCSYAHAEKLTILHTNDTHSRIDPDYDGLGGVARRKALIDSVRAVDQNVLLIDAGDIVQGTLFFNIYRGEVEEKLMNALGYDMRILGNHEFDNSIADLADNLKVAEAELLASNYQMRGTPLEGMFKPYSIKEYDGKRIAFLPINLQPEGMILDANYKGMGYVDALETANNLAWYLKNIEQADYVVAITHIGYTSSQGASDMQLAKETKNIDVIIGGHSHTTIDPSAPNHPTNVVKNADGKDVLIAQAGKGGKYLGEVTIDLDDLSALPASRLILVDSRLDSIAEKEIDDIIAPYRAEVDRLNSAPVAIAACDLPKDGNALLNFSSDFMAERGRQISPDGKIDLALLNKGGLRNDVPKGVVTEGEVITLMPFFNYVQVIDIKGSELAKAFDVMARSGGNGVSSEVTATFDPETRRCTSIIINGKPLDPDATYRVALPNYLAAGGDYMSSLKNSTLVAESENLMFDDMLIYLKSLANKKKNKPYTINPSDKQRMYPVKK